jgi:hypothetical protein
LDVGEEFAQLPPSAGEPGCHGSVRDADDFGHLLSREIFHGGVVRDHAEWFGQGLIAASIAVSGNMAKALSSAEDSHSGECAAVAANCWSGISSIG